MKCSQKARTDKCVVERTLRQQLARDKMESISVFKNCLFEELKGIQ